MTEARRVLAFDFGASSGRAVIGIFDGRTIRMEEVHRFENVPVTLQGTMYWDVLRLFHEVKIAIRKACRMGAVDSIAIDTWGVDFGLLDDEGRLLENPVHYRDSRTNGMIEAVEQVIPRDELYGITGNQIMTINSLFQLVALKKQRPGLLKQAKTLLFMPDLFSCFLCGRKVAEETIASTSQMMEAKGHIWAKEVLGRLDLPAGILPQIVAPGTELGTLAAELREELEAPVIKVVTAAGHDTQSAIVAVPAEGDFLFLSCGTWSLLGTELDAPVINEASAAANITNEGGYGGKTSFLKNIIGLWILQECRRQWRREGKEYSFGELERLAGEARPFQSFIHPDAAEFVPSGNMPERIRDYCKRTGQHVPESVGEIVRCIDESLALRYRAAIEEISACLSRTYGQLHIIGGGVQSALLCQMTANACGIPVVAGPVEATVLGNIAVQLIADGAIGSLAEARRIIKTSETLADYSPKETEIWAKQYGRWKEVAVC